VIGELIAMLDGDTKNGFESSWHCHENSGWGPVDFLPSESVIHPFFLTSGANNNNNNSTITNAN